MRPRKSTRSRSFGEVAEDPDEDPGSGGHGGLCPRQRSPARKRGRRRLAPEAATAPSTERHRIEPAGSRPGNANPVIARSEATKQSTPPRPLRHGLLRLRLAIDGARRAQLGGCDRPGDPRKALKTFNPRPDMTRPRPPPPSPEPAAEARPAPEAAPRSFFAESSRRTPSRAGPPPRTPTSGTR